MDAAFQIGHRFLELQITAHQCPDYFLTVLRTPFGAARAENGGTLAFGVAVVKRRVDDANEFPAMPLPPPARRLRD
jgi:hypothetical protein